MQHGEVVQRRANLFADPGATLRIGVRQQHGEFLAAVACRDVGRALGLGREDPAQRAQATIARQMSVMVVERLEMIEVDQ